MKIAVVVLFSTGAAVSLSNTASVVMGDGYVEKNSLGNQMFATTDVSVTPADIAGCVAFVDQFLIVPHTKQRAIEKAVDHCANSKRVANRQYACVHFKEALTNAFSRMSTSTLLSSNTFCQRSETYMLTLRGATRLPDVVSGPLIDPKMSSQCKTIVSKAFAPRPSLPASEVPDLWYSVCMNNDCQHTLPSRTRWCSGHQHPTHSIDVCEAARKFMTDAMFVLREPFVDAKRACELYEDFAEELGVDVEAYEHIVHQESPHRVPLPRSYYLRHNGAAMGFGFLRAFAATVAAVLSSWSAIY
eukprot:TRINITY_DN23546_c0_g1_i1.p1 TRINITY_DN23546_c0_g1~~TRINITY_DN23546_c0_g1_i1.p1  ORF type:complete len:301 (+),score=30.89 TRINITY_DN23546_c0_g1_i1:73-975(+)